MVIGVGTRYSDFTTASRTAFARRGRAVRQPQRGRVRRRQARRRRRSSPTPGPALARADRRAGRLARPDAATASGPRALAAEWDATVERAYRPGPRAAAGPGRGDRRGQRGRRAARRGGLRRRLDARRPAQAVAHPRPEGLPRRVRLLLHGLRDRRRRSGVKTGRHPSREVFVHGRRRLVPDDGAGDRHRRAGGHQAASWCWCRTTASPRSARCPSRSARSASAPATATAAADRPARRRRAAGRPGRQRREPRRRRAARPHGIDDFRTALDAGPGAAPADRLVHVETDPLVAGAVAASPGGTCRWPRCPGWTPPSRPASRYEAAKRDQRPYLEP